MNIEIWSDIACPFCYIGKRHFEKALAELGIENDIELTWRSFQLDPTAPLKTDKSLAELLSEKYGKSVEWAQEMNENVKTMAKNAGLNYDMESIVPTNSFKAHKILHLAKEEGKQDEMKERLLAAYFIEGKDTGNAEVLAQLAADVGLNTKRTEEVLNSDEFEGEIKADILQARNFGISGVPFFVINRKYGISGAQPVEHFVQTIKKVQEEEKES